MPTYDYVCKLCEHAFEHFQGMSDKHLRTCPECGKKGLERLIGSGAGVLFKGSGFYETDYKQAGRKDPESSSSKGDDSGSKSSGSESGSDKPTPGSSKPSPQKKQD